ncbi:Trafficking protein particle complex subunit 13, partial [Pygoscelis papua]
GNIFLGEMFSGYLSVHNDSNQVVKDIVVKADLQTSSQCLNLSASSAAVAELKPGCCIEDVIHHEVKGTGTHILVCAVSYTMQTGEKIYFRKFFKFRVLHEIDEVFLEAQIQNITTSPMFMEKVSLEPSIMYNVAELNTVDTAGESDFSESFFTEEIQNGSVTTFFYDVSSFITVTFQYFEQPWVVKIFLLVLLGNIVSVLSKVGKQFKNIIQRSAPRLDSYDCYMSAVLECLKKSPQVYSCFVFSSSERTMDLVLEMCNSHSIHWCGVSGRQLGKLHPSSSLHLTLTLLSSVQGLQSVSGLRLTATFLKRTYEDDDIVQVCVVSSEVKQES